MAVKKKWCKDCVAEGTTNHRPAPHAGPRCATHHRQTRKQKSDEQHNQHIQKTYGINSEQYRAIYEFQGRRCAICQRATGAGRRRLAVDHDHATGKVRGLLCKPCNRGVLGHLRDDVAALERAVAYLLVPPASVIIGD